LAGRLAAVSELVKLTVPAYPATVSPEESTAVTVTLTEAPEVEAVGALTINATVCAHAAGSNNAATTAKPTNLAAAIKRKRIGCAMQLDTV
jgi:hypothetical protein